MLVRKKKFRELESKYNDSEKELEEVKKRLKTKEKENETLASQLFEREESETAITLTVSDDLNTVTPITRYNPQIIRKLVETQYLPSNKVDDEFAIHLAVMLICEEAITEIISAFEQEFQGEDSDTGE